MIKELQFNDSDQSSDQTIQYRGREWIQNSHINFRKIVELSRRKKGRRAHDLSNLDKIGVKRGALVVSSGPSGDLVMEDLKEVDLNIWVAEGIFKTWYYKTGRWPDYIVCTDALPVVSKNITFADGTEVPKSVKLVVHPCLHPSVYSSWKGDFYMYRERHHRLPYLNHGQAAAYGEHVPLEVSMTGCVTNIMLQLVDYMGYDAIFNVGYDCGFPEGKYRADTWNMDKDGKWFLEKQPGIQSKSAMRVSENGVKCLQSQLAYKMNAMLIWAQTGAQFVNVKPYTGTITEWPQMSVKDLVEDWTQWPKVSLDKIKEIGQGYLDKIHSVTVGHPNNIEEQKAKEAAQAQQMSQPQDVPMQFYKDPAAAKKAFEQQKQAQQAALQGQAPNEPPPQALKLEKLPPGLDRGPWAKPPE